jgi:hypothetical protein
MNCKYLHTAPSRGPRGCGALRGPGKLLIGSRLSKPRPLAWDRTENSVRRCKIKIEKQRFRPSRAQFMAGPVPAIHDFASLQQQRLDARDKLGPEEAGPEPVI